MNEKEIGEIRRRTRRDRSNMAAIYGCYVNSNKEIISSFRQSVGMMPENEAEKYFGVMRRTMSGTIGKTLIDIRFQTAQVAGSEEHQFLMNLRSSELKDDEKRMELFKKIIEAVTFDGNYVILVGHDAYDVPFRSKDGEEQADASSEVYRYILCAVCPVKESKPALRYMAESQEFHDSGVSHQICAPEYGFLFPAFDDRRTNIYNALFYSHNPKQENDSLVDALFKVEAPKPAYQQKKSFEAILSTSLGDHCSMDVVQTVHEQICQQIEMHKESKIPDPLLIDKAQVQSVLKVSGVKEEDLAKFSVKYDETFGHDAQLHPKNIIDNRRFEIKTPDVSIKVSPDRTDLIETRIIEGVKCILICADENVEVNGVPINIED